MFDEIIGAVLQVLVFALIPFLFYWSTTKSTNGFFQYIGLKKSNAKANKYAVLACLIFALPILVLIPFSAEFKDIMTDPVSITGKIRSMGFGFETSLIILMTALIKTSLAEEILFRGFIAKRLIARIGYFKGNLLQAIIFGAVHAVLFAAITNNIFFLFLIFVVPATGAFVSVFLNEKLAGGSIVPGWISHGLANVLTYGIVGFVI